MKKKLILSVLALSLAGSAFAQGYEYNDNQSSGSDIELKKIRIGVFFAPAMGWMRPTASRSDDKRYFVNSEGNRLGYSWGPMLEYYFAENYGIATGFTLNTVGGKIATTYNPTLVPVMPNTVLNTSFAYNLQFLEIPFALKLRSDGMGKSGKMHFFGQIGLTLGVNISRKATYDVVYIDATGMQKSLDGDNEKLTGTLAVPPAMLQMNIGGGIEYNITDKMSFYSGLFFNNGFLPDATNPANYELGYKGEFSDGNIRLNSLGLRVGIFF